MRGKDHTLLRLSSFRWALTSLCSPFCAGLTGDGLVYGFLLMLFSQVHIIVEVVEQELLMGREWSGARIAWPTIMSIGAPRVPLQASF